MNGTARASEPAISDIELRRIIARSMASYSPHEVIDVERRPHDYHSSFAIEEVRVIRADGSQVSLILKHLSPESLIGDARQLRPGADYHPAREVIVYRDLLSKAGLGTALCYAAVADQAADRYLLLLEKVSETDLARTGEFAHWTDAARWLAAAHAYFLSYGQEREAPSELICYDSRRFQAWIERASRVLQTPQIADGRAVADWEIAWLLDSCRKAAQVVDALSRTIIHGEFYASNVLVQTEGNAVRICPIDWETAGMGPGLIDVAALVAGQWSDEQKAQLAASYFEAAPAGVSEPLGVSRETALACCQLLLAIKWVGWLTNWQPPPEHRHDWLGEALDLASRLNAELQRVA